MQRSPGKFALIAAIVVAIYAAVNIAVVGATISYASVPSELQLLAWGFALPFFMTVAAAIGSIVGLDRKPHMIIAIMTLDTIFFLIGAANVVVVTAIWASI